MAKLFVGCVLPCAASSWHVFHVPFTLTIRRGLSWNTDDHMLHAKFEEFGTVEEAVSSITTSRLQDLLADFGMQVSPCQ